MSHHFAPTVFDSQLNAPAALADGTGRESSTPSRQGGTDQLVPQRFEGCKDIHWRFWGMDGIVSGAGDETLSG